MSFLRAVYEEGEVFAITSPRQLSIGSLLLLRSSLQEGGGEEIEKNARYLSGLLSRRRRRRLSYCVSPVKALILAERDCL